MVREGFAGQSCFIKFVVLTMFVGVGRRVKKGHLASVELVSIASHLGVLGSIPAQRCI